MERAVTALLRPGEPDFAAVGAPGESLQRGPSIGEALRFSVSVHDHDRTHVSGTRPVAVESDGGAIGRNARVPDPPRRFVENLADGELEAIAASQVAHDGETLPVG